MFGGHIWELVIVLLLALVVFGPKRLPEIGGAMGKGIREFRKGTQDLEEKATGNEARAPEQPASTVAPSPSLQVSQTAAPTEPPPASEPAPTPSNRDRA